MDDFPPTVPLISVVIPLYNEGSHVRELLSDLKKALLSRSDMFVTTATEKMLTYALGRAVDHHDMPAIRLIVRDASKNGDRFSSLVLGVAKSAPFQMKMKN